VAAAAPAVGLSPTSLTFGAVAWLQAATQNVVLTNTGDAPLLVQIVSLSGQQYVPVDFTIASGSCPLSSFTIAPGGQCDIGLRFRPESGGPRSATLSIYDNAPDSPQTVTLAGTGAGAVITFTPRDLEFVNVPVGTTSAPLTFTAINAGDGPVSISSVTLGPTPSYSSWFAITADGCAGKTLGPGQRCTISATASPDAVTIGAQIVNFFDNAGTGEQTYDFVRSVDGLVASGGGPLLDTFGPFPASIQDVGTQSDPTRVLVHDTGTEPLQISGVSIDDPSAGFIVTNDTCSGTTLVLDTLFTPPSRCSVDVVFAPRGAGSFQANLVFHDNEFGGSRNVLLRGSGLAPAAELSTHAIDFGFQAVGVASPSQVLTLTNPTPQPLSVTGVRFSGTNPTSFTTASDSCSGTTVPAGGTCAVGVTFTPPFPYLFSATMSFIDNAPVLPQTVSLRGEGQAPTFAISTTHLDFGNLRAKAASAPLTFSVTNTSAGTLSFSFLTGYYAMPWTGCSEPVVAGASCTVSITVTPGTLGPQTAVFKVVDPASNQQVVQVDWAGITAEPRIESTIGGFIIQRVGDTLNGFAFVINGGLDALKLGAVSLPSNPAAAITDDRCSNQTVPAGGRCVISLTVHPAAAGTWAATLSVPTDAALGPNPATLLLQGIASLPEPVFSPTSVVFPAQQLGAPESTRVVWVDNGLVATFGSLPLTIGSVAIGGADASSFRIAWDGCSNVIVDAAYSCPVAVGFDPAARGALNATLVFSDDGGASTQAVPVSGIGLAPAATPSTQALDFGSVVVRSKSAPATLTLTSSGDLTLKVSRVTVSGPDRGDFTITSENCQKQSLPLGATCQVVIVFRPSALGTRSATLTFTDDAVNSPQSVTLTGVGVSR
jgi:hypothetical protein